MIDVSILSENGLPQRQSSSDPLIFVWPGRKIVLLILSVDRQLNLLTELSIIFVYFGLVQISR